MRDRLVSTRRAAWLGGAFLAIILIPGRAAIAFPFLDATNADSTPAAAPFGTDLPATDVSGLQNQLRLVNPAAQGNPGAWTIIPRISLQEEFTDNALELTSPRRSDLVTVISPGITILADTRTIKLNFDYQPSLMLHAVDGPLNVVTQQLNAFGTITIVPDLAFVDIRGASGVQSNLALTAGTGTLGAVNNNLGAGTTGSNGVGPGQVQGLNRNNEVQTSSFGISPYLLRQFQDYGIGKLGVSGNVSNYSSISGFVSSPIPAGGGNNGQSLYTTEEIASFTTGQAFGKWQDTISADLSQSSTRASGNGSVAGTSSTSERETFNNQVSYALNRTFTLLGAIGEQNIVYHPALAQSISGLTWNIGFTVTPSPDTSATLTYGHYNGTDAFSANAHMALTGRTLLSADYSNTVGSQLENIQNQLNASTLGVNGLVNAQTGGPAFVASNAVGVSSGIFRFSTFDISMTTSYERDTLRGTLTWSKQTSINSTSAVTTFLTDTLTGQSTAFVLPASSAGQTVDVKSGSFTWTHLLNPDMTASASGTYTVLTRSGGGGTDDTASVSLGWQYMVSAATTLSASYSFFDRISKIPGYNLYENLLLLGVTKRF
jgi:uncharacterized protein (PEP-CTERM system associated)